MRRRLAVLALPLLLVGLVILAPQARINAHASVQCGDTNFSLEHSKTLDVSVWDPYYHNYKSMSFTLNTWNDFGVGLHDRCYDFLTNIQPEGQTGWCPSFKVLQAAREWNNGGALYSSPADTTSLLWAGGYDCSGTAWWRGPYGTLGCGYFGLTDCVRQADNYGGGGSSERTDAYMIDYSCGCWVSVTTAGSDYVNQG